jgi:hypothetical protein
MISEYQHTAYLQFGRRNPMFEQYIRRMTISRDAARALTVSTLA